MLTAMQGVYRNGKVELDGTPAVQDNTPVIVTFIQSGLVSLEAHGIGRAQAQELRQSMAAFVEEWDSPDMAIYDNYDAHKLST